MRAYPHWLVGSLCAGFSAGNLVRPPLILAGFSVSLAAVAALQAGGAARLLLFAPALAAGGWWWSGARLDHLDRSVLRSFVGESEGVVAVITGPVRRGQYRLRAPVRVSRFGERLVDERAQLELPLGRSPPQGSVLELVGELRLPRQAEDGFDERSWLRRQGIHTVLRTRGYRIVGHRGGVGGFSDRVRVWLAGSLAPGVEGERRAVLAGIVLGADEGLSVDLRDRFRASGLYHLLAVSGQNVALLAGGVLLVAWLLGIPRWLGELGVLASIGSYVLAVGLQPSVARAGVAGALASLAWLAARPRDRWYFLLVGGAVLLAWNPYNLLEPGFQLSFAAVGAIFVFVPWLERRLEGYPVPRALIGGIAVSVACGFATAPIVWLHFGAIPVFSVASNVLAAPAVPPLLGLTLLSAVLAPVLPAASVALGWVSGWLAAYLAGCARLVGGLPHAQLETARGLLLVVGATLVVAGLARLRPPRSARALALCGLAGLAAVTLGGWRLWPAREPPPPPQGLRVTFLDVGQGDGILLQTRSGAVLVDQGPPEGDVAGQLGELGVRRLSALVLTHPQRDHVGGAAEVLERFPVELALDPRLPVASLDEERALAEARERGVRIELARAGRTYRLGRLTLRVLWPPDEGPPGDDPNLHATVLLASFGEVDVLLTADAESEVTRRIELGPVEVLKVAHHGSADPGLDEQLRVLRPRVAVISAGRNNDYGHPRDETLAALATVPGIAVYRTDTHRRVILESDGRRIRVRTER